MPIYLLHGFRWPRQAIRIHIILQNLDDAAADWTMGRSGTVLLTSLHSQHPDLQPTIPNLRLIEQFDPEREESRVQPYAYVARRVVDVQARLWVDLEDLIATGREDDEKEDGKKEKEEEEDREGQMKVFEKLRDALQPEAKIGWYVVYCGDEERIPPPVEKDDEESDETDEDEPTPISPPPKSPGPKSPGPRGWFRRRETAGT
ncbi:MAG: hypothetical protein M1817_001994 [Caeruleum heppii]|nr:MAG: hypothetical protein M1817_001994 [Caeruleum heppii]